MYASHLEWQKHIALLENKAHSSPGYVGTSLVRLWNMDPNNAGWEEIAGHRDEMLSKLHLYLLLSPHHERRSEKKNQSGSYDDILNRSKVKNPRPEWIRS